MPQSALDIQNSTLVKLGGREVTAWGDLSTKEGVLVNSRFLPVMGKLTRDHVWGFLKEITNSNAPVATTIIPWTWLHQPPTDLSRIVSVKSNGWHIDIELTADGIYTCYDNIDIRYIKQIPAAGCADGSFVFPDDFAEVLACMLAIDISVSLTQDQDLKRDIRDQYIRALQDARFNGACELSEYKTTAEEFNDARNTPYYLNPYPTKLH